VQTAPATHWLVHPSVSTALASSHSSSPAIRMPSPQIAVQTLGAPVQSQPGSSWQVAEQPSPGSLSPSSQVSGASTWPSLHTTTLFTVIETVAGADVAVPSFAVNVNESGPT